MTLPYSPSIATFAGNGLVKDFPFSFKVWDSSQLVVSVSGPDGVVEDISFSAKLSENGGTVTALYNNAPVPAGYTLSIIRNMAFEQEVDLISGTRFDPQVIEEQMDKATAERQQLREAVGRAIVVPPGSDSPPETLAGQIFEARDQAYASATASEQSAQNAAASAKLAQVTLGEVQEARDNALEGIAASHTTAVEEITTLHQVAVTEVTQAGQIQVANVTAAGKNLASQAIDAQVAIAREGDTQLARVKNSGAEAVLDVVLEGDTQTSRVHAAGNAAVLAVNEATGAAKAEADRAQDAADRAVAVTDIDYSTKQRAGIMQVGDGLTVDEAGRVSVAIPSFLSNPSVTFPATVAIGYPVTLSMSSSTAIPDATIKTFSVVFDAAPAVDVQATGNAGTLTVKPTGTLHGQTGTLTVTAFDTNGNASNDTIVSFIKNIVTVDAPRILSPAPGAVDIPLRPALQVQPVVVDGMPATPLQTQIQVSGAEDFSSLVYDSGAIAYTTTHTVTAELPDNTVLYLRVRHQVETYGWSSWGPSTTATTIIKSVLAPSVLSPTNGATGQALNVAVVVSAIATTGVAAQGKYTRLQIARGEDFAGIVFDTGVVFGYSQSVPTANLPVATLCYVRAQHYDAALGWSPWSATRRFTTLNAYTNATAVNAPANNATGVARRPAIQLAAHSNVGPADYGTGTRVQIATDAGFTNIVQSYDGGYVTSWTPGADLGIYATYFVRAQHRGATWGWGAWSGAVTFQTLNVTLTVAPITQPANGATGVSLTPVIKWAAPTAVNQGYVEDAVMFATNAGFSDAFGWGGANVAREYQVPAGTLAVNTLYYVRSYARGLVTGYAYGQVTSFRTLAASLATPSIVSPANGVSNQPLRPTLTFSDPLVVGQTVTGMTVTLHSHGTSDTIFTSGLIPYAKTYTITADLPIGRNVDCYVQYRGDVTGATAWSNAVNITIIAAPSLPVITSPVNNATNVTINPMITFAAPVVAGQTVTKMEVQISTTNNFSSIAWASGERSPVTSMQASVAALNTTYYVRARYQGSVTGWTAWGAVVGFTTMAQVSWTFTSSTTFTPPKAGRYQLECVGGGGGGAISVYQSYAKNGGSGGGGGYAKKEITIASGTALPIVVGGGGGAGSNGNEYAAGGAGGTSSIGSHISATGGGGGWGHLKASNISSGGNYSACGAGGGGSGSGGSVNRSGGGGSAAYLETGKVPSFAGGASGGGGSYGQGGGVYAINWAYAGNGGVCIINYLGE